MKKQLRNVLETAEVNHINVELRNGKITPVVHMAMLVRLLSLQVSEWIQDDTTGEQDTALRDAVGGMVTTSDCLLAVQKVWDEEGKGSPQPDTVPPPAPNPHVVKDAVKVGNGLLDQLAGKG